MVCKTLITAVYLNYFYLFFLVGLRWLYRGGSQHEGQNYEGPLIG